MVLLYLERGRCLSLDIVNAILVRNRTKVMFQNERET
jgi:hypothetical protein